MSGPLGGSPTDELYPCFCLQIPLAATFGSRGRRAAVGALSYCPKTVAARNFALMPGKNMVDEHLFASPSSLPPCSRGLRTEARCEEKEGRRGIIDDANLPVAHTGGWLRQLLSKRGRATASRNMAFATWLIAAALRTQEEVLTL